MFPQSNSMICFFATVPPCLLHTSAAAAATRAEAPTFGLAVVAGQLDVKLHMNINSYLFIRPPHTGS